MLDQQSPGIRRPPEPLVAIHLLAGHELGQPQLHLIISAGAQGQNSPFMILLGTLPDGDHH